MHITSFKYKCLSTFLRILLVLTVSGCGLLQSLVTADASQLSGPVTSSHLDAKWPVGPGISSETAILIEAETGTILYAKDIHKQMYPASITKILTTLIATERCQLDEDVTFTYETLCTIPYDSSRIWVDKDEYMSMEDCLAAILIVSANDVAAGVAEHVGGTLEGFADIMNERAKELGCLNSHFVNSHGYHDEDHYTTAYDMAQIGRAFFDNDLLCSFARERSFKVEPSAGQPDSIWEFNKNQLLATRNYEYEYLVGSKTGYTSQAGQTLVSCAQKDGMKLICVVMNATSPDQFKDTVTLFDFGFSNFGVTNIFDNDKTYVSADSSYGMDVVDVLGDASPLLNMDRSSIVVLPKNASFSDVTSYITMATEDEHCMATAHYQYGTRSIGSAQIYVTSTTNTLQEHSGELEQVEEILPVEPETESPIYLNIKKIALIVIPAVLGCFLLVWGYKLISAYRHRKNPNRAKRTMKHRFAGVRNFFILFCQGVQAIWGNITGKIVSIATRTRYKKRGYSNYPSSYRSVNRGNQKTAANSSKSSRSLSREYYSKSADLNRKDVIFHDLKK